MEPVNQAAIDLSSCTEALPFSRRSAPPLVHLHPSGPSAHQSPPTSLCPPAPRESLPIEPVPPFHPNPLLPQGACFSLACGLTTQPLEANSTPCAELPCWSWWPVDAACQIWPGFGVLLSPCGSGPPPTERLPWTLPNSGVPWTSPPKAGKSLPPGDACVSGRALPGQSTSAPPPCKRVCCV